MQNWFKKAKNILTVRSDSYIIKVQTERKKVAMESKNNDKRLEKGEETCSKILESALEVISQDGISGISAAKLSALSDISKSSIFYHFKNIQEIPEAVLQLIFNSLLQPIENKPNENLSTFLNRIGSSFVNQMEEQLKLYKSFFSFYHESMFNASYKELMSDFLKSSKEDLANTIKKLSGMSVSDAEATQAAALLMAALDGIGMHLLLGGDHDEYLAAWQFQARAICKIIEEAEEILC